MPKLTDPGLPVDDFSEDVQDVAGSGEGGNGGERH